MEKDPSDETYEGFEMKKQHQYYQEELEVSTPPQTHTL